MNTQALKEFLLASNQAGYSAGEEKKWRLIYKANYLGGLVDQRREE